MIIEPKIRGFVCITSHPEGCAKKVAQEINKAKATTLSKGPKNVLVIGASTGYGLSSRITAAFSCGASTLGVFFERPSLKGKPASAGWYNTVAFESKAKSAGLYAKSFNGDAFSIELKKKVVKTIQEDWGKVDCIVYSLASPRRTDPKTEITYRSCLKPIGDDFSNLSLDTSKGLIETVSIEQANKEEIDHTIKVMGGEDWELWMDALAEGGVLTEQTKSVAYSYIGPKVTWPIYKNGTIGRAKLDVERAAQSIQEKYGIDAFVSVNKAVVTQASSAIPVVPLYISILFKVMKAKGTHEGCIEQIIRLFKDRLYEGEHQCDQMGRIRLDDLEMDPQVQEEVASIWPKVTTENIYDLSDFAAYQKDFLELFGFGLDGVDYTQEVEVERTIENLVE